MFLETWATASSRSNVVDLGHRSLSWEMQERLTMSRRFEWIGGFGLGCGLTKNAISFCKPFFALELTDKHLPFPSSSPNFSSPLGYTCSYWVCFLSFGLFYENRRQQGLNPTSPQCRCAWIQAGIRSNWTWPTIQNVPMAQHTWKLSASLSMQTAGYEGSISLIDLLLKMSCQQSSSCICQLWSNKRKGVRDSIAMTRFDG